MAEIIDLLKSAKNIPSVFIDYTEEILSDESLKSRYRDILLKSPDETVKSIGELFERVSKIINCTPNELLGRLQFKKKDKVQTKLGALLAEMRAIVFLSNMGFDNIQLNIPNRREKSADFCARRGEHKFAIEVTNVSYFVPRGCWRSDDLETLLLNKILQGKKLEQLDITARKEHCEAQLLIFVIDTEDILAFNDRKDYRLVLNRIFLYFRSKSFLYFGIVTGMKSEKGVEDFVYPPLL